MAVTPTKRPASTRLATVSLSLAVLAWVFFGAQAAISLGVYGGAPPPRSGLVYSVMIALGMWLFIALASIALALVAMLTRPWAWRALIAVKLSGGLLVLLAVLSR